jgi:hypothetical protein
MQLRLPPGVSPAEPAAVVVAAVLGILSVLGVWSRLELSPEQVAELHAYLIALAAALRGVWQLWRARAVAS